MINRYGTGWRVELARKSPSKPLVSRLPITKARINLGAVVKRVHVGKEYVILEKGGLPVVAIMDIDEFEDYLEVKDASVKRHIAVSAREHAAGKGRPAKDFFEELEAEEVSPRSGVKRRRGT